MRLTLQNAPLLLVPVSEKMNELRLVQVFDYDALSCTKLAYHPPVAVSVVSIRKPAATCTTMPNQLLVVRLRGRSHGTQNSPVRDLCSLQEHRDNVQPDDIVP